MILEKEQNHSILIWTDRKAFEGIKHGCFIVWTNHLNYHLLSPEICVSGKVEWRAELRLKCKYSYMRSRCVKQKLSSLHQIPAWVLMHCGGFRMRERNQSCSLWAWADEWQLSLPEIKSCFPGKERLWGKSRDFLGHKHDKVELLV